MEVVFRLERSLYSPTTTLGTWFDQDGVKFSNTLEDAVRADNVKVYDFDKERNRRMGVTAIPGGTPEKPIRYKLTVSESRRFGRKMIMLSNTSYHWVIIYGKLTFKGVRVHRGNKHQHTDACILVGYGLDKENWKIYESKQAEIDLTNIVDDLIEEGNECFVDVVNLPQVA